jgi:N-acetylmuramoyl-L-alanine amidase
MTVLRPLPGFLCGLLLLLLAAGMLPDPVQGQANGPQDLRMVLPDGRTLTVDVERHRGFASIPAGALDDLGWSGAEDGGRFQLTHRTGVELRFNPGSPYLEWDRRPIQMVHAPYRFGDDVYVPLQLVVDLLPGFFPAAYEWDGENRILQVEGASISDADLTPADPPETGAAQPAESPITPGGEPARADEGAEAGRAPRIVVIDPGHGGRDTGAVGPGGLEEKEVALAVGLALAQVLREDPDIEVRLTRGDDEFIPLWDRGARATEWKGDRPGLFLSIHANALPDRPDVRGFETYFLSEARTEHEERVAAAENAPLRLERSEDTPPVDDPLLAEIIRDLRTFDHQHWSALLAEKVQEEMGRFHPGPDRGVKQGPFAVITNSMMPSVLIEVGFLTHREEEGLLTRPEFHQESAEAIARSVRRFFQRYPPGSGSGEGGW